MINYVEKNQLTISFRTFSSSKNLMPATRTYSPLTPQNPAESLQTNTCRYARYAETHPVQPLKGLREPRTASVSYRASVPAGHGGRGVASSYRASSPYGETLPSEIKGNPSALPQPTPNSQLLTPNWSYTFSAKEKDSETGLSYFGSRYYSSDLSVWLSVDPMSDKYPSLSPYTYCADNPVRLVDPNGEEISLDIIYKKDANGNDTKEIEKYNIRITGKILNRSGRKIDMEKAKEKIINQIETSFKGQTKDGIPVTTSANFEVANSYKEVKNNDHLFVLTNDCGSDNGHSFKGYTPKNGGMVALVNAALFKGPIDGTFGREGAIAAAHEMGHMFGLNHVGNPFNLMRTGFFHNRLNSFVSSRQLGNIIRNIQFKSPLIKKVNNR